MISSSKHWKALIRGLLSYTQEEELDVGKLKEAFYAAFYESNLNMLDEVELTKLVKETKEEEPYRITMRNVYKKTVKGKNAFELRFKHYSRYGLYLITQAAI